MPRINKAYIHTFDSHVTFDDLFCQTWHKTAIKLPFGLCKLIIDFRKISWQFELAILASWYEMSY